MICKKYNEILKNLEEKLENKNDFTLVKSALSDLTVLYTDELTKLSDSYNSKITKFETRLNNLESKFQDTNIEIENINLSEKISCPYCNFDFLVEYDDSNHEITYPKCNNLIELDWGDFEDDM